MKLKKTHLQVIIILVVGALIASIVFAVGATVTKKKYAPEPTTTLPFADQTTLAPATTQPPETTKAEKEEKPSETKESTTKKESTTAAAQLKVPGSKKAVIDAYLTAVNNLKNTPNFNLALVEGLEVGIDEMTGGSTAKSLVQKLIDQNSSKAPQSFKFVDGMDAKGKSPSQVIAPRGIDASISPENVVSATAKKVSNTAYKLTIDLGKQTQTLDSPAPGYSTIVNTLNPETFDLPSSISISEMNVTYNNSKIEATIDKDGRIISMKHHVEVPVCEMEGKITLATVTLKLHGNFTSSYTITY